tara:strand:- start:322 stop:915 length:594 start_codon:yes stop_codon:yes gene_type:complete
MIHIITLTGPCCSGKSTLEKVMVEHGFGKVISVTTRPIRQGEVDAKDYYFVAPEYFDMMDAAGQFVECVDFNGYRYGVSVAEIQRLALLGKPIVVVCDPHGKRQFKVAGRKHGWTVHSVFVDQPDEVLIERLLLRAMNDKLADPEVYRSRLRFLLDSERHWRDKAGRYDDYVVPSDMDWLTFYAQDWMDEIRGDSAA